MTKKTIAGRLVASMLVFGACGAVSVYGAKQAKAQGMHLGSATALADHSEVDISGKSILLSGGVNVVTPDGQKISSDTMRLTMGPNPATGKDDLSSAVAEGHVVFIAKQAISATNAPAQKRTIQGSSDKITWDRYEGKAVLTGHVTVSSDDPVRKMTWRDAGSATIDLLAGKIVADRAPNGPQMTIEASSKAAPAAKKTTK
ncbi:MAG TPA: LptA/OstA family protein [Armatimonadota bacterium]|jgi:lipopolysaccharide export system protein LptA